MTHRGVRLGLPAWAPTLAAMTVAIVFALSAGAEPTGTAWVDTVLVSAVVLAAVGFGQHSPWWARILASGAAAVLAFDLLAAFVGVCCLAGAIALSRDRAEKEWLVALVVGGTVGVGLRSELPGSVGLTAVAMFVVLAVLIGPGFVSRPRRLRVLIGAGVATAFGLALVATVAASAGWFMSRDDLREGVAAAEDGLEAVNSGEYERAAALLELAAEKFDGAGGRLGGLWTRPSMAVPVVAQNVRSTAEASTSAAELMGEAAAALVELDPSRLRVVRGAVDLDQFETFGAPLRRVQEALVGFRQRIEEIDSPWLFAPVNTRLAEVDQELADNEPRLQQVIDAVRLAPQLLGEFGNRRYLILFTTPAEARGLGGFPGNYATLDIDDGKLAISAFGRIKELNGASQGVSCADCPDEFLERYGRFGFDTGPLDTVGTDAWSNITMAAHFPYVGETAAVLWRQAHDEELDGVIVMDPYVVQALMQYAGPIEVPAFDQVIEPDESAEFILRAQYLVSDDQTVRVSALDALGTGAINAILSGQLPDPPTLLADLAPLVSERRLLMWTPRRDEQELLGPTGLLGELPEMDSRSGGFSVAVTNGSASKIDAFLERSQSARVESVGERRRLVADVTLRNGAPASGLPLYVIGNSVGLPPGTSRLYVTFYGPPGLRSATVDGEELVLSSQTEAGWTAYSYFVDIASMQTVTYRLEFDLPPTIDGPEDVVPPSVWMQPLADRAA